MFLIDIIQLRWIIIITFIYNISHFNHKNLKENDVMLSNGWVMYKRKSLNYFLSVVIKMDISELSLSEEDYTLKEFFPKTIPYHLQPLIEHRIQLILKENTTFHGGDIKVVNTCCMLNGELKRTKLSMFLIPTENLGLVFESGGYISNSYKGRVVVKLANHSGKTFKLQSGTPIGYLVLQPYSLEKI